ncbi:MAG: hypothetical protein RI958_485 [Actinomycetota bacterium]|jgi:hypothetical protein
MALFRNKRVDPAEVAAMQAELRALRVRVESAELVKAQLEEKLKAVTTATNAQSSLAQMQRSELTEQIVSLRNRLGEVDARLDAAEREAGAALERATTVGSRVDSVAVELANQLTELGREIDTLVERSPAADTEGVLALRASQVKLAAEQARYEISFREDLAALAEQVRQLRGRG